MPIVLIVVIALSIGLALLSVVVILEMASHRNRSVAWWVIAALLYGPLAVVLLYCLPARARSAPGAVYKSDRNPTPQPLEVSANLRTALDAVETGISPMKARKLGSQLALTPEELYELDVAIGERARRK